MPQLPRTSTPTENLAGPVERVTFHNDENGFCVLRVKARGQRDLIIVLGHAAMISAGEFVQASGTWVTDSTTVSRLGSRLPRHFDAATPVKDWSSELSQFEISTILTSYWMLIE
jgi:hypothetical protein